MAVSTKGIYIIAAKRTPFAKYGGKLRDVPACHMFAAAAKDALNDAHLDPALVDTTVVGNVNFLSQCDGGKTARYCGIYSGVPLDRPALAVNKACGSGLQAVINGAQDILTGSAKISLTGGTENMSSLPHLVRNVRFGTNLGSKYELQEYISKQTLDSYCELTATEIADKCAKDHGVTRRELDEFAFNSHLKWNSCLESGMLQSEITPVTVKVKNQEVTLSSDEQQNTFVTKEELSSLPGDIVTSGNSASTADGAAAIIIASDDAVSRYNLSKKAQLVGWACVGTEPENAGLGAAKAITRLLDITKTVAADVDLFEINETFAAHTLSTIRALNLDEHKVNVGGGALAIGNPVGATGTRFLTHLVYQLRQRNLQRGVAASTVGGGQGIAVMIEIF